MASGETGFVWVKPPDELAKAIKKYGDRVLVAITAVMQEVAMEMANEAREQAPWEDRTGNARSGIFGTAERDTASKIVFLYLSHGPQIDYGVFLELAKAGRYAVLMPVIEANLPKIHQRLQDIFS